MAYSSAHLQLSLHLQNDSLIISMYNVIMSVMSLPRAQCCAIEFFIQTDRALVLGQLPCSITCIIIAILNCITCVKEAAVQCKYGTIHTHGESRLIL